MDALLGCPVFQSHADRLEHTFDDGQRSPTEQFTTLADPSRAGHLAGELVCPACGQLGRPAPGGPGRCPDCAVDLVPVP